MIAQKVIIEGRVQGVGFRYTVKDLARGFDVSGTVKNLADGSVELLVMGEADEVDDFINEIVVESAVASGVKNHYVEEIPLLEQGIGFRIVK